MNRVPIARPLTIASLLAVLLIVPALAFAAAGDSSRLTAMHNREREQRSIATLSYDRDLASAAQRHADDMAVRQRIYHSESVSDEAPGYDYTGENVGTAGSTQDVFDLFMESDQHRDLILDGGFDSMGAGVAERDGSVYVAVLYGGDRSSSRSAQGSAPAQSPANEPTSEPSSAPTPAPRRAAAPRQQSRASQPGERFVAFATPRTSSAPKPSTALRAAPAAIEAAGPPRVVTMLVQMQSMDPRSGHTATTSFAGGVALAIAQSINRPIEPAPKPAAIPECWTIVHGC